MQATLYLQGGYDRTVSVDSFTDNIHAAFVRGTGRYFFEQNLMLEATGQYAKGARDFTDASLLPANGVPSQPFQTLLWQAKLEWKPAMMPFSFFVKYQGSETRYDTLNDGVRILDQKTTDQRFLVGARLYSGQGITLKGNDRAGTTLDIIDPLGSPSSPLMFGSDQFAVSDIRLKTDIAPVGQLANGLNLYRYRYLWSDTIYVGVMAQEVAAGISGIRGARARRLSAGELRVARDAAAYARGVGNDDLRARVVTRAQASRPDHGRWLGDRAGCPGPATGVFVQDRFSSTGTAPSPAISRIRRRRCRRRTACRPAGAAPP